MYLITIVASIPAQFVLYHPLLNNPEYVLSAGHDARVMWGGFLELITALACIGTAVVLFPVVRRHHEAAALGFVSARVLEAAFIVTGIVSMLSVTTLRQPDASGAEATSLVAAAQALVAIHDATFLLGPGVLPGINALLLGYLMYRSGLVPRIIPRIGLLGAPFFLAAAGATIVGANEPESVITALVTLPIFAWEAALGVRLVISGFTIRLGPVEPSSSADDPLEALLAGRRFADNCETRSLLDQRDHGAQVRRLVVTDQHPHQIHSRVQATSKAEPPAQAVPPVGGQSHCQWC